MDFKEMLTFVKDKRVKDALQIVIEELQSKDTQIDMLQNKLDNFNMQDELIEKDKIISQLMNRECFDITEDEQKAIDEWVEKHTQEKHNGNTYSGAIGGRYTYEFTPTSIGTIGIIKCSCGDEFIFKNL